jgi:hypothetical protein
MRSILISLALGLVAASAANRVAAEASPIATSMGDLRWGLSEQDVSAFARRKLAEHYGDEIKKTHDAAKQAQLKAALKTAQADVTKSLTSFEGSSSRWDHSPVAGEFSYGNGESMLVAKDDSSENYYFFLNGRLWKWYKALDKGAAGGDFKKFSQSVESKFGKGHAKKGELTPGHGTTQWVEYIDRNSRMRAADTSKRGGFSLIFEEMATVRELASTHSVSKPSRLAGADDEAESKPATTKTASKGASSDDGQMAKASTKRSVFGSDHRDESESDYQARKDKAASDARDRQVRAHERKEDAKKGEALKQLDGLNDSDPLGGL